MPNLKQLIEELEELSIDPRELRLPGQLYDALVEQAETIVEENPAEEEE